MIFFCSGAFKLYDVDNDGYITRNEMYNIVDAIYQMVVSKCMQGVPINMRGDDMDIVFDFR